MLMKVGNL